VWFRIPATNRFLPTNFSGKPKLRDIARIIPTVEEAHKVLDVAEGTDSPIASAILGATLIERELETLLRDRLSKKDDNTWISLTSESGPFGTFSRKIAFGNRRGRSRRGTDRRAAVQR
jgi:hypothetical protein